jgi:nicotinate-nucleotide adenylyltransferase
MINSFIMRNIALYGGAFDPPHIGHLQLIHALTKVPEMDEVWLLPCGDR